MFCFSFYTLIEDSVDCKSCRNLDSHDLQRYVCLILPQWQMDMCFVSSHDKDSLNFQAISLLIFFLFLLVISLDEKKKCTFGQQYMP